MEVRQKSERSNRFRRTHTADSSEQLTHPALHHHQQFHPQASLAGADAEKAAMVEQAKTRVAAVKESLSETLQLTATARRAKSLPSRRKKKDPSRPTRANHPLVKKLKAQFDDAMSKQSSLLANFRSTSIARASLRSAIS